MTQEEMNALVPEKLAEIERERGITILYSAEAGSRAWGFESPDSDFDVRFIYRREHNEYLRLNAKRDVIELPINDTWDVSGWDLDKTLKLLRKSNPSIYEWLSSPICYRDTGFAERLRPLLQEYFSPSTMLHHYLSISRNNLHKFLQTNVMSVKRYLYILRPLLACYWVMEKNSPPPVKFSELAGKVLPDELRPAVENLVAEKMKSSEKSDTPPITALDKFISESFSKIITHIEPLHERPKSWDSINAFFLQELSRP